MAWILQHAKMECDDLALPTAKALTHKIINVGQATNIRLIERVLVMETVSNLNEETIKGLQELICINIDSADGFHTAAEEVSDPQLKTLFGEISKVRSAFAEELRAYVVINDEVARDEGSLASKLHQWWMQMRGRWSTDDVYAILAEAEFGEDAIKDRYEKVLTATAGSAVNDVLTQHYVMVKSDHDRIRDLRDERKAQSNKS